MRPIRVKSSTDLGPQLQANPHGMVGQDGAFSIALDDGTALWFFGDTVVGRRTPGDSLWYHLGKPIGGLDMSGKRGIDQMLNNTGLILRDKTGAAGLRDFTYLTNADGTLKCLLPLLPGEVADRDRIWCQHGIEIEGTLILSFIKVITFEEARWPFPVGFEIVGSGLAVGSKHDWRFERVVHQQDSVLWRAEVPHFGVAFVRPVVTDGFVYVYGSIAGPQTQHCHVARVPIGRIEQFPAYEYFDGSSWSSVVTDSTPVMEGMPSEVSVSWNAYLGCYLAVHSDLLSGRIVGRTARNPWGLWSAPTLLWHARPKYGVPEGFIPLIYAGKEHPTLSDEGGRVIYLTYIEFEEYYPHLVRIELG
jgi:hypothetical protein